MTAGIQSGNTSEFVAQRWLAEGAIAKIHYYPYDGIHAALADLEAGKIGLGDQAFPGDLVAGERPPAPGSCDAGADS